MKQGGRPRRSEEQPDSPFGEALKEHLRRVKNFTQAELAKETLIAERILSNMVKGKRTSGTALRRDLRAIIKALYQKKALHSLEEANLLITKIPAIKELDERDPDDAEIIEMLKTSVSEIQQTANQNNDEAVDPALDDSSKSKDSVPSSNEVQEQTVMPLQTDTFPVSETAVRQTKKRIRWQVGSVLVALVIILGVVLGVIGSIFSRQANTCSDNMNGVTLYTDINYQGQCHTFSPGS